ncbi:MAG TPA: SsgA family sporulation/cell division regulator [Streptosporangiaceae bacterium]|nr:SsgA family sporulation/cell division regulator [Streptosporangiaceae bacterium]
MMESGATVSAELGLMLVVPQRATVPLVASLSYSADDPYAVRMAFHVGTDETVEWIFARDLLGVGMDELSGEGDVQVWPSDEDGQPVLHIVLSSPFGQAHFVALQEPIAEFLRRAYDAIPAGREGDYIDIGGELDGLLWQA